MSVWSAKDCHTRIYDDWMVGVLVVNNVRCFICHSSFDKNFVKRLSIDNCCFQIQVNDLKTFKAIEDCFVCHQPHSLYTKFQREGGELKMKLSRREFFKILCSGSF